MSIVVIAVIAFVILIILVAILMHKEKTVEEPAEQSIFKATQKFSTQYIAGHPQIKEGEYVYLVKASDEINIVERKLYQNNPPYKTLTSIPYSAITTVETENQSGIEKKFSLGRFMLIGVYAFAWLKKEPKETGYLVIKWKDGVGEHATIFKNEEKGALKDVALARNAILHWIKQSQTKLS